VTVRDGKIEMKMPDWRWITALVWWIGISGAERARLRGVAELTGSASGEWRWGPFSGDIIVTLVDES
jgi:hypothetical protein